MICYVNCIEYTLDNSTNKKTKQKKKKKLINKR